VRSLFYTLHLCLDPSARAASRSLLCSLGHDLMPQGFTAACAVMVQSKVAYPQVRCALPEAVLEYTAEMCRCTPWTVLLHLNLPRSWVCTLCRLSNSALPAR